MLALVERRKEALLGGESPGGRYRFPAALLLRIGLAVALGQRRSVGIDSGGGLRGARPTPRILGVQHIPRSGPFILVGNHYQRPGMWAGWGAMVMNVAVHHAAAKDLRWLMVSELLDFRLGPMRVPRRVLRFVFSRFVRVYGFGLVSAREAGAVGGVAGLRAAARYLAAGEALGVLPEGTASLELCEARPGVGEALAWLSRGRIPLVSAAVAEEDGAFTARFGPPFHLEAGTGSREERDRRLRDQVMRAIGRLLPEELWGYYRPLLASGP